MSVCVTAGVGGWLEGRGAWAIFLAGLCKAGGVATACRGMQHLRLEPGRVHTFGKVQLSTDPA